MRKIEDLPLWLGNVSDSRDLRGLYSAGIVAVIDLAGNESPAAMPHEIVYCRFPLVDGAGNPFWLLRAAVNTLAALLRENVATLAYCGAGLSRTPSIAAMALSCITDCSAREVLERVTRSAPADVSPALWADLQAAMED